MSIRRSWLRSFVHCVAKRHRITPLGGVMEPCWNDGLA